MMQRPIALRNGVELPRIGLGTFKAQGQDVVVAVKAALAEGIQHIDTASIYKNEEQIACALRESGVQRSSVFITSKVSPYEQGESKARAACNDILSRLQTDSVDLVLIHFPGVAKTPANDAKNARLRLETWRVLEDFYRQGKFRAIGVSNYEVHHLIELLGVAKIQPMVNQFEVHPRRPCNELRELCSQAGVAVVAYASLGCGDLLQNPVVCSVANQVHKSPAQVLLRWGLQQGLAVIPKSVRPERIQEFTKAALLTWQLQPQHMAALDALADGHKYCWSSEGIL